MIISLLTVTCRQGGKMFPNVVVVVVAIILLLTQMPSGIVKFK